MDVPEIILRCQMACESEAVSRGFPAEAGFEIFYGCVADDIDGWSDEEFEIWNYALGRKWAGVDENKNKQLTELYVACNEIMGEYGKLTKTPT